MTHGDISQRLARTTAAPGDATWRSLTKLREKVAYSYLLVRPPSVLLSIAQGQVCPV